MKTPRRQKVSTRTKVYQISLLCGVKTSHKRLDADLLEDLELEAEVSGLRIPIEGVPQTVLMLDLLR